MSVDRFIDALGSDEQFADWFTALLADAEVEAFYFECPAVTADTLTSPMEFVLLDAPALAQATPDWTPFAQHFDAQADPVVVFPNLGGDAVLVVPRPAGPEAAYAHLAAFVRTAPAEQVRAFWQAAANALAAQVGKQAVWLNTEGSGIPWLHLRLDTRPKYYHYRPYTRPDRPGGPE